MNYLGLEVQHYIFGKGIVISRSFDEQYIGKDNMYLVFFAGNNISLNLNVDNAINEGTVQLLIRNKQEQLKDDERQQYGLKFKYVDYYYPKTRFSDNNKVSQLIYNMKFGEEYESVIAMERISEILYSIIPDGSTVCVVPSSVVNVTSHIENCVNMIKEQKQLDVLCCFKRIKNRGRYSQGGIRRHPDNDLQTIEILKREQIKGKKIILLDDICTTGSTFTAFKELLLKFGARTVECISIGNTMSRELYKRERQLFALMQIKGLGRKTIYKLLTEEPEIIDYTLDKTVQKVNFLAKGNARIVPPTENEFFEYLKKADKIFSIHRQNDIEVIAIGSDYYPASYEEIDSPPILLYAKGNLNLLKERNFVGVIGTRTPTEHGAKAAKRLGAVFSEQGFIVVSGLAAGCDKSAHEGCLEQNGRTIAILPSPIDNIMPKSNQELANRIVEEDGLLLSEYHTGQAINNGFYAERDRLQSGLCNGVIVAETTNNSGTMITVKKAFEYSKAVGCYVHPEKYNASPETEGNRQLLADEKVEHIRTKTHIENFIKRMEFVKETLENKRREHSEQIKLF